MKNFKKLALTTTAVIAFVFSISAQKNYLKDADIAYENHQYFNAIELYKQAYTKVKKADSKATSEGDGTGSVRSSISGSMGFGKIERTQVQGKERRPQSNVALPRLSLHWNHRSPCLKSHTGKKQPLHQHCSEADRRGQHAARAPAAGQFVQL